ncbi:MAG: MBL fold metallo-hydrolase [Spirochaetaceae bacterium]|nr:MAG: MBL fold metallo-hydrolase [Spirochaetaceae bacterium]
MTVKAINNLDQPSRISYPAQSDGQVIPMMNQVITVDCNYIAPQVAAAYILIRQGRAVFIENNTSRAVPGMLRVLREQGLQPGDVEYAVVTHAHLDHAAGSRALIEACPNAQLLCHPRATRHLIDPTRLVQGTTEVYGADRFQELYGEVGPVPADRVRAVQDGETIDWHGELLEFYHTPGHASHHLVMVDRGSSSVFTGDAFGVAYPLLQRAGQLVLPSSPPTDFDAALSIESVTRIVALGCEHLYPTHFGRMPGTQQEALHDLCAGFRLFDEVVEDCTARLQAGTPVAEIEKACRAAVDDYVSERLRRRGLELSPAEWELLGLDRELNTKGLAFAAGRRLRKLTRP